MDLALIVFTLGNQYFDIDSSEVVKVVEVTESKKDPFLKGNGKLVYAHHLLDYTGSYAFKTSLIIRPKERSRIIFHIPYIDDLLTIKETDIIPLPDFIKKRHNLFLIWGMTEQKEKLILLMTFNYYLA